jgi:tRNA threonylcarbamoyl adenosine modification protein YeaZ
MINLFIDTSLSDVSIACLKDNTLLNSITRNIPNKHSVYTLSYIKEVLDNSNIDKKNIDNIYVVNGPGSFTGIRIGLTIAKTYSYLLDKPLIAVSSLKAIALSSNNDLILSIIKANSSNYYIGLYDKDYNEVIEEQFINRDNLIEIINKYNPYIVSNEELNINDIDVNKVNLDFSKIINYYKDSKKYNSYELKPNYLKLPQAMENKK